MIAYHTRSARVKYLKDIPQCEYVVGRSEDDIWGCATTGRLGTVGILGHFACESRGISGYCWRDRGNRGCARRSQEGDTESAGLAIAPCRTPSDHCTTPIARMMRSLPPWTDGSLHHSLRSSASAPLAPRSSASPSIANAASSISARRSSWNA